LCRDCTEKSHWRARGYGERHGRHGHRKALLRMAPQPLPLPAGTGLRPSLVHGSMLDPAAWVASGLSTTLSGPAGEAESEQSGYSPPTTTTTHRPLFPVLSGRNTCCMVNGHGAWGMERRRPPCAGVPLPCRAGCDAVLFASPSTFLPVCLAS
jgi:hypothetical protein